MTLTVACQTLDRVKAFAEQLIVSGEELHMAYKRGIQEHTFQTGTV